MLSCCTDIHHESMTWHAEGLILDRTPKPAVWGTTRFENMDVSMLSICLQAMEPFFSVLLSSLFLGESPSLPVIASLLPVVGGVALASTSEVTFNWPGFLAAMGSNVTFQSRNVFSKKFMGKAKVFSSTLYLSSIRWDVATLQ